MDYKDVTKENDSYGVYVIFSPDKRYLQLVKEWVKKGIKNG